MSNEISMIKSGVVAQDMNLEILRGFFNNVGVYEKIKAEHNVPDSFSNLIGGGLLKVISIQRGKISCSLTVKAPILFSDLVFNLFVLFRMGWFGGMHGGAVGAVAERVAIACARTVVGKDMEIFLGELTISYLIAAPHKVDLLIDASVIRKGRNLTVVAVHFRLKESDRLAFTTWATFYNIMPVSRL
ncbi:hypothetical protein ACJIZ3_016130 [Penstemon smallii]|uniref:Thioesterase domain-containing protein n=1 Tax=Penstemon smallii TaxID=265156 RepID=A0ABD3RPH3_9LAMI